MLRKVLFQINAFLQTFYSSKNHEKCFAVSTKLLSKTTVFNIDNFFLEHQISILEWFLKDHVTLKTEVMAAESSALLLKYIKIGKFLNCINIVVVVEEIPPLLCKALWVPRKALYKCNKLLLLLLLIILLLLFYNIIGFAVFLIR